MRKFVTQEEIDGKKARDAARGKAWRDNNKDRQRAYMKDYYQKNKAAAMTDYYVKSSDPEYKVAMMVRAASRRAKAKGLKIDDGLYELLTTDLAENCPCCGVRMDYAARRTASQTTRDTGPSIDRVDNRRGYELDNVKIICYRCNSIKRDGLAEDFENLLGFLGRHGGDNEQLTRGDAR